MRPVAAAIPFSSASVTKITASTPLVLHQRCSELPTQLPESFHHPGLRGIALPGWRDARCPSAAIPRRRGRGLQPASCSGPRRRREPLPLASCRPGRVSRTTSAAGGQCAWASSVRNGKHAGHPPRTVPISPAAPPQCQGGACGLRDEPRSSVRLVLPQIEGLVARTAQFVERVQPLAPHGSSAPHPPARGAVSAGRCPRGLPRSARCPPCPDVRQSPEPSGRRNGWCACPGGSPSPSRGAGRGR